MRAIDMNIPSMSIDEYKTWKKTRGEDSADWDRTKCAAADYLIKYESLVSLNAALCNRVSSRKIREFVLLMCRVHFGSFEVDNLIQSLHAYPKWI